MSGLLLKDFYTLLKQMKVFLVILIVWACIPGFGASSFAIVYASIMPLTALAYDERCKWNQLAAMMPYSVCALVISKYALGYALSLGAAVLALIAQLVFAFAQGQPFSVESLMTIPLALLLSTWILSFSLPLVFRLGVEKGRLFLMALIAVFAVGSVSLGNETINLLAKIPLDFSSALAAAIVLTVVINLLSIWLSQRFYLQKR